MSMKISNNYSNYTKSGTNTTKESNVTTSIVELKFLMVFLPQICCEDPDNNGYYKALLESLT